MKIIFALLLTLTSLAFFFGAPIYAMVSIFKRRDSSTLSNMGWMCGIFLTGPIAAGLFFLTNGDTPFKKIIGNMMVLVVCAASVGAYFFSSKIKNDLIAALGNSAAQIQTQESRLTGETKVFWSNDLQFMSKRLQNTSALNVSYISKANSIYNFYQRLAANSDLNDNDYADWNRVYQSCDAIEYKEIESFIALHNRKPVDNAVAAAPVPQAAPTTSISQSAPAPQAKITSLSPELLVAATRGNLNSIQDAVKSGVDVNAVDPRSGMTLLHVATHNRQLSIVQYLVDNGADINKVDHDNSAPIHYAAYKGDLQSLKLFISKGAALNGVDKEGLSPLGYAKAARSEEKIQELLKAGAK